MQFKGAWSILNWDVSVTLTLCMNVQLLLLLNSIWVQFHCVSQPQPRRLNTTTRWPELEKQQGGGGRAETKQSFLYLWSLPTANSQPFSAPNYKWDTHIHTRAQAQTQNPKFCMLHTDVKADPQNGAEKASYCFNSENTRWFSSLCPCWSSQQRR